MLISQRPTLSEEVINDSRSQFVIEPLEPGFGYTLGNSLRRTLLSSIPGAAVTSIRIDGVLHEFTTVPGVKEDVTDIILNLKGLVVSSEEDEPVTMYLRKQGPGEVTAGDIVPPAGVTVHNPGLHIATLNDKGKLEVELVVERGRGYVPAVQNRASGAEIGRIPVDSIYSPVLKVTYKVDATRVEQRTDFDKLILDVETKSSISPRDALASAGKTLVELFSLARELNVEAEGIEIGPSPAEADHIASFALPIDDLDLTVRSYNCLKREGVHTVGELVSRTESDLLDIRNFGQKSIDEVKVKLHQLGLSLKDSPPSFDPSEVAGYDVATGTWSTEGAYDDQDYAETEQLDQGLAGAGDRVAGAHARLGLDVQDQLVEVGALLDTRGLDLVGDPHHRRVDRVDRDPADLLARLLVLGGGHVAAAALDGQLHLQLALAVQRGDVQIGVVHLNAGGRRDVGGRDLTGTLLAQVHRNRLVVLGRDDELLQVQDDVGDVLDDPGDGRELVQHTLDPDAGDSGTGDRGEQGTADRVADRVAEPRLERLDGEPGPELVDRVLGEAWALGDEHWWFPSAMPVI